RLPMGRGSVVETVHVDQALATHRHLAILGDPGSGKTTLMRYLALQYARDLAQKTGGVQARLGLDESGFLPILISLRQVGAFLRSRHPHDDGTDGHALFLEYIRSAFRSERIPLPDDFFDEYLTSGRAAILLDGLDEVADPDLRRRVSRLVEAFTTAYAQCRFVVTSRVVGYTGAARLGGDYALSTVRDFTLKDVENFLSHWHRLVAVGQMGAEESALHYAADQTAQLMAAIRGNERIRDLAINPLMLTVIALVHRDRVKLPDRRAELYAEAVDVLLGKWDEARGVREIAVLADAPFDTGDKRLMLQAMALQMQENQQKEIATEDLRRLLAEMFAEMLADKRGVRKAVERFQRVIEERTGLLVARGEGIYAFSHLTFQEYLAALAIAARDDYVAYTLARCGEAWWREVTLL
ncbi:MAG: NACHT domain-containing protein, partial [Chloroflexi bacterium]|nr:NACHT domain-containing protein [Chloroflexota bacterium]